MTMHDEDDLVELPNGEIRDVKTLSSSENAAYCEWLIEKAERANRTTTRMAQGLPTECDYWDTAERAFCNQPASVVVMRKAASYWISDPLSALCADHRILAM
jgi:hypothetical protein